MGIKYQETRKTSWAAVDSEAVVRQAGLWREGGPQVVKLEMVLGDWGAVGL